MSAQHGGASGDLDLLGEIEVRTSPFTFSGTRLEEGKRLLGRLLGNLVRHRVDRVEDISGQPVEPDRRPEPAPLVITAHARLALARDVDTVIADFNRHVGARVIAAAAVPETRDASPGPRPPHGSAPPALPVDGPTSETHGARRPDRVPSIDHTARVHRLPPVAPEMMSRLLPRLEPLVREGAGAARRRPGWESLTLSPSELSEIDVVSACLHAHALARYRARWSEEAAATDGNVLGAHLLYLVNFELPVSFSGRRGWGDAVDCLPYLDFTGRD